MALRWVEDGGSWLGHDDNDRFVAQVARHWLREGRWAWEASFWGDRPPGSTGPTLGADPTRLDGNWPEAASAMAAVDARAAAGE